MLLLAVGKADIIFNLDISGGLSEGEFYRMMAFIKSIVRLWDINSGDVRVGFVLTNVRGRARFNLKDFTTKARLLNAIDAIPYSTYVLYNLLDYCKSLKYGVNII